MHASHMSRDDVAALMPRPKDDLARIVETPAILADGQHERKEVE